MGVLQISAGLELNGFTAVSGTVLWVGLIVVLSCLFLLSALSGVGKGIQYISNFNMVAAGLLALMVLIFADRGDLKPHPHLDWQLSQFFL